ncbi:hypothetical protein E2C01_076505 [Portunus trituberculatus]|uniref:Uncharacterized protein n=1 Tax=Portunus trituberculatus TaxID=210409 RepID=A0A5B7IJX6_PORTR|nr:hypothetical protein [Portunus trituberculatus]
MKVGMWRQCNHACFGVRGASKRTGLNPVHGPNVDQLDTIMNLYSCQNAIIVRVLNQHLVSVTFAELTVVHRVTNHKNIVAHKRVAKHLRIINTRKAPGPEDVSSLLLKHSIRADVDAG